MLLILHPYKFTLMHKQRMELELLKKEINTKIEIRDLGEILNKDPYASEKKQLEQGSVR